ncbi:MAG: nucleoside:proton symporter [Magnetococcales bacterium]|nr:nucleoside:proton symporter [Magnetococcales bacterium]
MESFMNLHSLFGFFILLLITWTFSERRKAVSLRVVATGVFLQIGLAWLLLSVPVFQNFFIFLNDAVEVVQNATRAGTAFVFGYLGGGEPPFKIEHPEKSFILALNALPLVLVISAISSLLFHWRVLPWVVNFFSIILHRTMGVGGALGFGASASIFLGMVEAPLLIKPYLERMSRSELFALMTCGMATIAGTMMALYAGILGPTLPNAMGHIFVASIISAPAAIMTALILIPEEGSPTEGEYSPARIDASAMDAITRGVAEGVQLLIHIIAMLVVLVALVALTNRILGGVLPEINGAPVTLERLLGWGMAPVVWLMGIPWNEAPTAGQLMGTKTVLNEFIAYLNLAQMPDEALSPRSRLIMTYALCGFANFGSLGIMIGGLGTMAPSRREAIVALGMKSILSGTLATLMTGAVVGILM